MIGDKRHTEALDGRRPRVAAVVGERSGAAEAPTEVAVEVPEVRMQT